MPIQADVLRLSLFVLSLGLAACGQRPVERVPESVERVPESPAYAGASGCEEAGTDLDTTLARSASGTVAAPVRVGLVRCSDQGWSYSFETERQRGAGSVSLFSPPSVLLADLNFDGHSDLWATGYPDGQGRVRTSDVWLFDPERSVFVLDSSFSALPNLDLAPAQRRLAAGVWNCGCGGACYFRDVYAVEGGQPAKMLRYEQECVSVGDGRGVLYREYERSGDSLRVVFETSEPNDPATVFIERDPLEIIDHTRYGT